MSAIVSVPVRSKRLQAKMQAFLDTHYRLWADVSGFGGNTYSSRPESDYYRSLEGHICFDHSTYGWERFYIFALCRWMAIKVGKKRKTFGKENGRTPVPVPYIAYEGEEFWPVRVVRTKADIEAIPKDMLWTATSPLGIKLGHKHEPSLFHEDFIVPEDEAAYEKDCERLREVVPGGRRALRLRVNIMYRHSRKSFLPVYKKLTDEVERLDQLWEAQS